MAIKNAGEMSGRGRAQRHLTVFHTVRMKERVRPRLGLLRSQANTRTRARTSTHAQRKGKRRSVQRRKKPNIRCASVTSGETFGAVPSRPNEKWSFLGLRTTRGVDAFEATELAEPVFHNGGES